MNYMQQGGFQQHPLMRLTLCCTGVFLAAFVLTNFLLYFDRMDLTAASVVDYYRGSEAQFRPPRSYSSMLEVSHGHMAMMALVLLLLTHLAIFAPLSKRTRVLVVIIPFSAGLLSEASSWLVRYVHPGFAPLKILAFAVLQLSLIFLLISLGRMLLVGPPTSAGGDNGRSGGITPEVRPKHEKTG